MLYVGSLERALMQDRMAINQSSRSQPTKTIQSLTTQFRWRSNGLNPAKRFPRPPEFDQGLLPSTPDKESIPIIPPLQPESGA